MNKRLLEQGYKGKKVFITGITGFKGSWLALLLHRLGAEVHGLGLEPEGDRDLFYLAEVDKIATVYYEDITTPAYNAEWIVGINRLRPDFVFHLAAQPIVKIGYDRPYETFHTNIMGTVILHETLRSLDYPVSIVNVTTDKVYSEKSVALSEEDELQGYDPYALSKSCSDMISQCYRDVYGNHRVSTARAGNVIGGGDFDSTRLVPNMYYGATGGMLEVRSMYSVRPYQHVLDALTGYLYIALKQNEDIRNASAWNVGPVSNQAMAISELIERMERHMDFNWKMASNDIGYETSILMLDISKILRLGWKPAFTTNEDVVKLTANWYNEYIRVKDTEDYSMKDYTLSQIDELLDRITFNGRGE